MVWWKKEEVAIQKTEKVSLLWGILLWNRSDRQMTQDSGFHHCVRCGCSCLSICDMYPSDWRTRIDTLTIQTCPYRSAVQGPWFHVDGKNVFFMGHVRQNGKLNIRSWIHHRDCFHLTTVPFFNLFSWSTPSETQYKLINPREMDSLLWNTEDVNIKIDWEGRH